MRKKCGAEVIQETLDRNVDTAIARLLNHYHGPPIAMYREVARGRSGSCAALIERSAPVGEQLDARTGIALLQEFRATHAVGAEVGEIVKHLAPRNDNPRHLEIAERQGMI
jgi:hypothetical protein